MTPAIKVFNAMLRVCNLIYMLNRIEKSDYCEIDKAVRSYVLKPIS